LILVGVFVELIMPLGILTGVADRLAAFIMAGYCAVTAALFKRFWEPGDFWKSGESKGRELGPPEASRRLSAARAPRVACPDVLV